MSGEPQLFKVNPRNHRETSRIEEVDFSQLGLKERQDIQEWVAAHPGILDEELLMIGKEFSDFDKTNERPDLLAVDRDGRLVVIELKRDDSGTDAHWQAIKYASYFRRFTTDDIIGMLADYLGVSKEDASVKLLEHVREEDDLTSLNNDQRIILASHRFAPEVTSAALWLNEQSGGKILVACVTLTPYQDEKADSLYIQANTIIPVPGVDDYVVGKGKDSPSTSGSSFAENMRIRKQRNKSDEVTAFVEEVRGLTMKALPDETRPQKTSYWAGGWPHFRYYNFWYSHAPWANHVVCYNIHLRPQESQLEEGPAKWSVIVGFTSKREQDLRILDGVSLNEGQEKSPGSIYVKMGSDTLNDAFVQRISEVLCQFINGITPKVKVSYEETGHEDVGEV